MKRNRYNPNQRFLFDRPPEKIPSGQRPIWEVWHNLGPTIELQAKSLGFNIDEVPSTDFGSVFYLRHPLLVPRKIEARPYLINLLEKIGDKNSIVVLPTGLGKTMIAESMTALAARRYQAESKKTLILAPTKLICDQHFQTFRESMPECRTELIIGTVSSHQQRLIRWQNGQIIVATAETILQELENKSGIGDPAELALVFFDEIHHLSGDHPYCQLAKHYLDWPGIQKIGLTGSLPVQFTNIEHLASGIGSTVSQILAKDRFSEEVMQFTYHRFIRPIFLERKAGKAYEIIKQLLREQLREEVRRLEDFLDLPLDRKTYFYSDGRYGPIIGLKMENFVKLPDLFRDNPRYHYPRTHLFIAWGIAIKVNRALQCLEKGWTEFGHFLTVQYFQARLFYKSKKTKDEPLPSGKRNKGDFASWHFLSRERILKIVNTLKACNHWEEVPVNFLYKPKFVMELAPEDFDRRDPKLETIVDIIAHPMKYGQGTTEENGQILIVANDRITAKKIVTHLKEKLAGNRIGILTGTSHLPGIRGQSPTIQKQVAYQYNKNIIRILTATSVAEEGIDFPAIKICIVNDVSTFVRFVQQIGRTARHTVSWVYLLIYEDTRERTKWRRLLKDQKRMRKIFDYLEAKKLSQTA